MKKFYSFTIFLLLLFFTFIPITTIDATSGTCSSHNGINCYFGPDTDGSAICNDGWKDSTENYNDANVCFQCTHPDTYFTGCKNNYDLGKIRIEAEKYGGLMSSQATGMITNCENEIKRYNEYMTQYNECQSNRVSYQNNSYQTDDYNSNSINQQIEQLKQQIEENQKNIEIQRITALNNLCRTYGAKEYNEIIKNCICGDGYVFVENKCMTHTEDCQDLFGEHIYGLKAKDGNPNNSDCYCDTNYNWAKEQQKCLAPQNDNIITPVMTKEETNIKTEDKLEIEVQPVVAIHKVNTVQPIITNEVVSIDNATSTENVENNTTTKNNTEIVKGNEEIKQKSDNLFTKINKFIKNIFNKLKFW